MIMGCGPTINLEILVDDENDVEKIINVLKQNGCEDSQESLNYPLFKYLEGSDEYYGNSSNNKSVVVKFASDYSLDIETVQKAIVKLLEVQKSIEQLGYKTESYITARTI